MADRFVVVSKSGPMKAGNRLEEKTRMSMRLDFFFERQLARKKKVVSHTLLSLQKRRDRGEGNVLRQSL